MSDALPAAFLIAKSWTIGCPKVHAVEAADPRVDPTVEAADPSVDPTVEAADPIVDPTAPNDPATKGDAAKATPIARAPAIMAVLFGLFLRFQAM